MTRWHVPASDHLSEERERRIELARALGADERWDDALAAIPASETANDVPALLRATALRNLQRFGEAEQVAREALTQTPDDRDWHIELTRALGGTERWGHALAVVPPSLSPNDEAALLRSIILRMLGRFGEAEQVAREALTQAPDDRDWRIELARALLMQEQWDDTLAAIPASETANDVPALLGPPHSATCSASVKPSRWHTRR